MPTNNFALACADMMKLLSIWPACPNKHLIQMAKEVHGQAFTDLQVQTLRDGAGASNPMFTRAGRAVVEWSVVQQISVRGYKGLSREKLVGAATEMVERLIPGKYSQLMIAEWVEDYYDRLGAFAKQPMKYRVLSIEKKTEAMELLGCQSLPETLYQG